MSAVEWARFTAGKDPASPSSAHWTKVTSVKHGTHLTSGTRIAEDQKIAAELIYDGKLATTRTKAVFFSPNYWGNGSRYGTLGFDVDWPTLLAGRTLYWVEPILTYKIPVHRFLLSRKPPAHGLVAYDPDTDAGPLRRIDGQWYRTSDAVSEILTDEDVDLSQVTSFDITMHHEQFCSLQRRPCEEAGNTGFTRTSRRFQAALLGRGLTSLNDLMIRDGTLSGAATYGLYGLPLALGGSKGFTGAVVDNKQTQLVLRGALLLLAGGDATGAAELARLLVSADVRDAVLLSLIREHYDLPTWEWD
ncbi:hypothetical protein [Brevundimonas diminuta]|uniref:hypothetical protein n=1 Tax=Brevundimonas diminuta TaxID=293 RepID=UPI003D9A2926